VTVTPPGPGARLPGGWRPRSLLILVTIAWAVAWPAIKLGVSAVPPLWYACLRYGLATVCLFAVAGREGLVWPSAADRRLVAVSALSRWLSTPRSRRWR
jgi:drug/metabolite transporter (DMT)-like permease